MTGSDAPERTAPHRVSLEGWPVVGAAALVTAATTAWILGVHGTDTEGLRRLIRISARLSGIFFLAAFLAAPLLRLHPVSLTRWLRRNRRQLGVSVGVSHGVHGVAIGWFVSRTGEWPDASTLAAAGLAYLFLGLMVATSFDRTAAWLGRARWRRLHASGLYYLWFVFGLTFAGSAAAGSLASGAFALAFGAALPVRLVGLRGRAG